MNSHKLSRKCTFMVCFFMIGTLSALCQTPLERAKKEMELMKVEAAKNGTTILPEITVSFDVNKGAELKWYNQYDVIQSIAIQKSDNKDFNFKTIAYLKDNKKGVGTYLDENVSYGTTFYRLLIVFGTDMNWYSNVTPVTIDSSSFIQFYKNKGMAADFSNANPIDSLAGNSGGSVGGFATSSTVFYDLFDEQVHIKILSGWNEDSQYSLIFKNPQTNKLISKINRLPKRSVIVDPRNFNDIEYVQFELYRDKEIIEQGYINIQ